MSVDTTHSTFYVHDCSRVTGPSQLDNNAQSFHLTTCNNAMGVKLKLLHYANMTFLSYFVKKKAKKKSFNSVD